MTEEIYKSKVNSEGFNYVNGPGCGLGYYSHTLFASLSMASEEEAVRAARIANIAYKEGYAKAQYDIRVALGVTKL